MWRGDGRWRVQSVEHIAERMRKRHKGEAEHKEDFETCLRLAEKAEEEREERRRWEQ